MISNEKKKILILLIIIFPSIIGFFSFSFYIYILLYKLLSIYHNQILVYVFSITIGSSVFLSFAIMYTYFAYLIIYKNIHQELNSLYELDNLWMNKFNFVIND